MFDDEYYATPMQPIPLPWDLKHDTLTVVDRTHQGVQGVLETIKEIHESYPAEPDEAVERILRGAILLMNRPDNKDNLADCLYQAVIWECG